MRREPTELQLDFWSRFTEQIEQGSKTQAIRRASKRNPRVGDICECFGPSVSGGRRLLGRWFCVKVESIVIYERGDGTFGVVVDGFPLSIAEKQALAWKEGFRGNGNRGAFTAMMLSGAVPRKGKGPLDFSGHVMHWDFNRPLRREGHAT